MTRRKARRFNGTKSQHRGDASSFAKEARSFAQKARRAAREGRCGDAVHLFGVTAFRAGLAMGNRKWAGGTGRRAKHYMAGSRMGGRVHDLQKTIMRLCRIPR